MNVVGFHRGKHPAEATKLAERIRESGIRCDMLTMDVGSSSLAVDQGIGAVKGLLGEQSVKVLVHSLSGASIGNVLTMAPDKIEKTFNHMAHSFLYWARGLDYHNLLAPNAHIIALTSLAPEFDIGYTGVIGPAKAALNVYVRQLAAKLGPKGHRVNAVCFGTVMTPAVKKVAGPEYVGMLEKVHAAFLPNGRMQEPKDVAPIVCRLAQDGWTNGAIIDATGGLAFGLLQYAFTHNG